MPKKTWEEHWTISHGQFLSRNSKWTIYGATACLHDCDEYLKAPGGKIFKYDPNRKQIEILGIPVAHNYIQTIALDKKRKIICGFSFPVEKFFRYDLRTNKSTDFGYN